MVTVPRSAWEAMEARLAAVERHLGREETSDGTAAVSQLVNGEVRTDRRGMLKHGALLAAGAAVGGTALMAAQAGPASATTGTMMYGNTNNAGAADTTLESTSSNFVLDVFNLSTGSSG